MPVASWWLAPFFLALAAVLGWAAFSLNAETGIPDSQVSAVERASASEPPLPGSQGSLGPGAQNPASAGALNATRDLGMMRVAVGSPITGGQPTLSFRGPQDDALLRRLEAVVANALATGRKQREAASKSVVSYRILDLAGGRVLAERQPTLALAPASNLKIITTFAALSMAGLEGRFVTRVGHSSRISGGVLEGDLIVRAGADPLFDQADASWGEQRLEDLARALANKGLRRIRGDLVGDVSGFADPGPAPGWPKPQGSWTSSYAMVAGLTVQGGMLRLSVEPGSVGDACWLDLHPAPVGLKGERFVETVSGSKNDVRIGSIESARRLNVEGSYGSKLPRYQTDFRHVDPPHLFLSVFRGALERAGIEVEGELRVDRVDGFQQELAYLTTPVVHYLEPINRDSENSVADSYLFWMGQQAEGLGQREAGVRAAHAELRAAGIRSELLEPKRLHLVGGSGLSRDNRVTAALLTELLAAAHHWDDARGPRFKESLAAPGTGTLAKRLRAPVTADRVRAKSGWIKGVSALCGYVDSPGGPLAFSILVNYPRDLSGFNANIWKPMHDSIVTEIAQWGSSQ